jgi:hypothetical protein
MTWTLEQSWTRFENEAKFLWRSGADGRVFLISSALAVGVMLVLVVSYSLLRSRIPFSRTPLAFPLLTTGAMLGSCFWLITSARQSCLSLGPRNPTGAAMCRVYSDTNSPVELAVRLVGIGVVLISLAWIVIALRTRVSQTVRVVALVCAVLVSVTAWVARNHRVTFPWNANFDPEAVHLSVRDGIVEAQERVADWQARLMAMSLVGVIACLAVSLREQQRGRHVSNRGAFGAALLLGLGTASYAATRAEAADVRLRIPHLSFNERCHVDRDPLPPIVGRCVAAPKAPVLELPGPQRVASDQSFVEGLIAGKRLWMQINPGKKFPGAIVLAVASDIRVTDINLAGVHVAGYDRMFLLMHSPSTQIPTNTLGVVSLWHRCCALEIRLDSQGEPANRYATYRDLVRAANEATQHGRLLAVAP